MVREETIDRPPRENGPGMTRTVADFAEDVISLAELQAQLFAVDLREAGERAVKPGLILVVAPVLLLAALPVLLFGLAGLLVRLAHWSEPAALLTIGMAAIVMSLGAAWWAWKRLGSALSLLGRSGEELAENVRWLKGALMQRGNNR